jgi:hypothetical protein
MPYNTQRQAKETEMTATQVQLQESTQEYIKQLVEESYYEPDMWVFINEHGEDNFVKYYEEFVSTGEKINDYDAVDAFVEEFGLDNLQHFEDAYNGEWSDFNSFAENFFDEVYGHMVPEEISNYIDYDAFANDLKYDYLFNSNYVFYHNF